MKHHRGEGGRSLNRSSPGPPSPSHLQLGKVHVLCDEPLHVIQALHLNTWKMLVDSGSPIRLIGAPWTVTNF